MCQSRMAKIYRPTVSSVDKDMGQLGISQALVFNNSSSSTHEFIREII